MYCWMLRKKTGLIFIYKFILVVIVINMFVYNSLHYFPNLKARRQKVVIKNNSSAYCEISAGVPQGSVLEPLLFIIYINDIADKLISLSRLFADDTSFGYSNRDTIVRLRRYFNLRRMFKCLDTLLLILSTWLFHLASLLNVTPKCLWEVVMGTDFPQHIVKYLQVFHKVLSLTLSYLLSI
jgi:flagellar biosynthesis protein FlhB